MFGGSVEIAVIAGAFAAFTVDLLIYPLDTIKTRYQSQDYVNTYARTGSGKVAPSNVFKGLYQGIGSVIFATLPAAGIFFITYESAKPVFGSALPSSFPQAIVHALASGSAELASCTVLTPAEVIKQNAQMLRQSDHGHAGRSTSAEALRMVWRSEGGAVRNLWTGYTALAARNLPFTAMQFPLFEYFRGRIWDWRDRRRAASGTAARVAPDARSAQELQEKIQASKARLDGVAPVLLETGLITGGSAAVSGALAAFITTPTDVVKTKMMLSAGNTSSSAGMSDQNADSARRGPRRRNNGFDIAKDIIRQRGVHGLFRGGALRAIWTALGSGLYLGSYEVAKAWLKGGQGGAYE
ncbi:mitochondrial carrier domain-containing protein [Diplogelasinospora grovesii]|uniref:Mitochondrial carrier domain-containing protein n=1 Tax=Diplogelasinospora grovesii TaxID=303347 RepID=A0AAN6NDJ8_9PEZI|nr:mitochondrial carrier domain-containing protein [Diplogelasinospora grovesii]